jgi:hypothetical protein
MKDQPVRSVAFIYAVLKDYFGWNASGLEF